MNHILKIDKLNGHDTSGTIGKIKFAAGDAIKPGDVLFSIESGKGSIKYKSEFTGTLTSLSIKAGDTVVKGQEIGSVDGEKANAKKKAGYSFGFAKAEKIEEHADVLIVGGGPGGYVAAIRSAQLDKKVVLIEEDKMGGTCLNYGCIPTKTLAHSTKVLNHIQHGEDYGFHVSDYTINIDRIIERKQEVVDTLVGGIEHLMESNDVMVLKGTASVKDQKTLVVKNKKIDATVTFDKLIIATGSKPFILPIEGADSEDIMTSKDALEIQSIPKSITIIGGGVIGMEFAFIFNALGSEVTVIEYLEEILCLLDQDVVDVIKTSAEEKGIKIFTASKATAIQKTENNLFITQFEQESKTKILSSQKVLMAVGRQARIDSLDLNKLGVQLNEKQNGIQVDETMRTSNEHIYAIGDVTNILQLAHVASHQGMVASEVISGLDSKMTYDVIPSAIFTTPEIGHVGLSEKEALDKNIPIKVGKFPFMANGKALAMGESEGFVKLILNTESGQLIGGTIIGSHGTDMIATLSTLIGQKIKLEDALHTVYAHPTAAESIHEALLSLEDRGLHNG